MKKNEILTLKITDINNLGAGVAHLENNMAVFVSGACDGDVVKARVIKVAKTYLVAKLLEVLEPSPHRIKSDCEIFSRCGGCATVT